MFGVLRRTLGLFCSFTLCGAALAQTDYIGLQQKLVNEPRPEVRREILARELENEEWVTRANKSAKEQETVERMVAETADAQRAITRVPESRAAQRTVQDIKRSAPYIDREARTEGNWVQKGLERIGDLFRRPKTDIKPPDLGFIGNLINVIAWTVIAIAGLVILYLIVRYVNWRVKLTRKTTAVLEEDEPERSLDEWLALADRLESEGNYREAVRALYLACLLKFDEARIARFDRHETNWEHLARIEASHRLPPGMDFRPATQLFDQVWYGFNVRGKPDVDDFRRWYAEVVQLTQGVAA